VCAESAEGGGTALIGVAESGLAEAALIGLGEALEAGLPLMGESRLGLVLFGGSFGGRLGTASPFFGLNGNIGRGGPE